MSQKFKVTGIKCSSCFPHLEKALKAYTSEWRTVKSPASVSFILKEGVTEAQAKKAISAAGEYGIAYLDGDFPSEGGCVTAFVNWARTYFPLLLIVGFIILVTTILTLNSSEASMEMWMGGFMAGFFIVFSFFKFLDINGFATAYATYDILAKRWHNYGYIYPFMELSLGILYLSGIAPVFTYSVTILIMGFSSIGVVQVVMNKQKIRCACLGTMLHLPMSTLTIVEDLGMAWMACVMLFMSI